MARQAREHVQAGLLAAVAAEPAAPVRRDTAAAVAAAARLAVPAGQWPALLPWLGGMAGSDRPEHREAALDMLSRLVRTIGAGVCLVGGEVCPVDVCVVCLPLPGPGIRRRLAGWRCWRGRRRRRARREAVPRQCASQARQRVVRASAVARLCARLAGEACTPAAQAAAAAQATSCGRTLRR